MSMGKKQIRIILKSGADFSIYCDDMTIEEDECGNVLSVSMVGVARPKVLHLKLSEIAAVIHENYRV